MADGPSLRDKWLMLGAVMADRRLTPAARHVAWALLNDQGPRGCYPGIDRLRAYTGLSRTAVQGAIAKLESCGWFVRDAGHGRGNSSRYHWQWEKGQQAYTLLMDGLGEEKAKLRDKKGQHSFTEKANTAWPEPGKEPCTDTGRARARAGAGAGEGLKGKATTSPASVPAEAPEAAWQGAEPEGDGGATTITPAQREAAEAIEEALRMLCWEHGAEVRYRAEVGRLIDAANNMARSEAPEAVRDWLLDIGRDTLAKSEASR